MKCLVRRQKCIQGDHYFCTSDCAGADQHVLEEDAAEGGIMPSAGAGVSEADFFAEALSAGNDGDDDNVPEENAGIGWRGDVEGDPESEVGTGMKGLPKVTLGPCKGSAGTVPSLRASLITSSRIFTHKLDRWDDAGVRFGEQIALMELRPRTKEAELRLSVWSPLSRALSTAVDRVQTICSEAIEKLEDTLRRLDKVVATAYPVSLQSLGIGNYVFVDSQFIPKKYTSLIATCTVQSFFRPSVTPSMMNPFFLEFINCPNQVFFSQRKCVEWKTVHPLYARYSSSEK